jgi:exodeoxyribonuclease VII large subunit
MNNQKIFSVSELSKAIKSLLEGRFPFISVAGEISNLRRPGSGHCYFTLKDDRAQVKAVLFKMQQRYLEKLPRDGQMVVCQGRITVYEPRGDYQLIVDSLDFHGAGALQLAFEQLKSKLTAEGLFDQDAKKQLPPFPRHITLITSPTGAAVHDFIRIAQARYPLVAISVYPAAMQGDTAAGEIRQAIIDCNEQLDTDIIVLCRGGGSIEDLWAFNDEVLARTIHNSKLPVVSAVGHEIDFTIADFAADLRAPTPSGAAEMLLPDSAGLVDRINELTRRLNHTIQSRLDRYQDQLSLYKQQLSGAAQPVDTLMLRLDQLADNLEHAMHNILGAGQTQLSSFDNCLQQNNPLQLILLHRQTVQDLQHRLLQAGKKILQEKEQTLIQNAGLLEAVSPLATLARGYAVARKKTREKTVITDVLQVKQGEKIEVILNRGRLECSISDITQQPEKTICPSGLTTKGL